MAHQAFSLSEKLARTSSDWVALLENKKGFAKSVARKM
jgi:hypothetical protein